MRITYTILTLTGIAAIAVVAPNLAAPRAFAKAPQRKSPEVQDAIKQRRLQESIQVNRAEKPVVDLYFQSNYKAALAGFQKLEAAGNGDHSWQSAMCLLRLGRPAEGLASFRKTRSMDPIDYYDLKVALAIASKDEQALRDAAGRGARFRVLSESNVHTIDKSTFNQPIALNNTELARNLMTTACNFGAKYDYETMHLVANEAMRRGGLDAASLRSYAIASLSNGDLRIALDVAKKAEAKAKGAELRFAHDAVYDITNLIYQYSQVRPIEDEEKRGHEIAKKFNRRLWMNDAVLATPTSGIDAVPPK